MHTGGERIARVGFITYSSEGYGGTQVYARTVTDSLAAMGIDVKFLDLSVLMRGVKGLRFPNYIFAPRFMKNLKTHFEDSEIVHANNVTPNMAQLLLRFKRMQGIPLVFTAHELEYLGRATHRSLLQHTSANLSTKRADLALHGDVDVSSWPASTLQLRKQNPASIANSLRDPLATWSYRRFLRGASSIISPTRWFATLLRDVVRRETPVVHMYSPLPSDIESFSSYPHGLGTTEYDEVSPPEAEYAIFIGKLLEDKGALLLPRLAHMLRERLSLKIVGTGPLNSWIREAREETITHLGSMSERAKLEVILRSSVLVFPSVCPEPGPATILEAFALGRPVVAFDSGGQAELVKESGCGLLAKPFDLQDFAGKVERLVEDPKLAKEMGKKGREFVADRCEPHKYTRALLKLYQTISP